MGRIARSAFSILAAIAGALLIAGCADDSAEAPANTTTEEPKTEMVFLAQYEKLRTQACPVGTGSCAASDSPRAVANAKFEACMTQALKNVHERLDDQPASKAEIERWLVRSQREVEGKIQGCHVFQNGASLAYGRMANGGLGYGAFPTATANMTGSPVDVIVG